MPKIGCASAPQACLQPFNGFLTVNDEGTLSWSLLIVDGHFKSAYYWAHLFDTAFTGSNMQSLYPEQFILSTVIYTVNTENIKDKNHEILISLYIKVVGIISEM